jgi:predicted PurR-regulated permease PerM
MNPNGSFLRKTASVIAMLTASVLTVWLLVRSINVLLMVFASMVLAVPIAQSADWGRNRLHIPRWLSLTISVLLLLGFLGGIGAIAIPTIADQSSQLYQNLGDSLEEITGFLSRFRWGRELTAALESPEQLLQGPEGGFSETASQILGIFSNTINVITWPLLVLLISVYFSAEPHMYLEGASRLLPPSYRGRAKEVLGRIGHILRWWLFGQAISMLILGAGTTLLLWILDIPLAFLLGLLTAFMTFIPILGPIMAGIPILLISLTVSPLRALVVGAFYLILQNIEGSFITPTIHRKIIAMPPVLIISVQIVLASLIGFVGVLLAMPLVACAMVLVRMVYVEDLLEGGVSYLKNRNK